jgi:hypothetical protein
MVGAIAACILGAMFALVIPILYRGISLLMPSMSARCRLRRFKNLLTRQAHGGSVARLHLESTGGGDIAHWRPCNRLALGPYLVRCSAS